ncbi:MAG: hypothetical protein JRI23_30890 [Deltaproteobacteria bacterium]|nr:hypothetical protein [Deltaproteobacteria bacterium]MBW2536608.1 hypothetical protein [Deltaproteobacteria bacterium]
MPAPGTPSQGICEALVSPTPSMRMSGAMWVSQLAKRGTNLGTLSSQFRELLELNLQHPSEDVQREMLTTLILFDPKFIPAHQEALRKQEERRARWRAEQELRRQEQLARQPPPQPPPPRPRPSPRPAPQPTLPSHCPTLPKGPLTAMPGGPGNRIVVTVFDYVTLAPLAGVKVTVKHKQRCSQHRPCRPTHPHPKALLEMESTTNRRGRVIFHSPDQSYGQPHLPVPNVPGYLNYSSHYNLGAKQCHELVRKHRGPSRGTVGYDIFLVPTSMLTIKTRQEAIDAAHRHPEITAFRRANPHATLIARGGGSAWQVGYAIGDRFKIRTHINAFDGHVQVSGRWR